MTTYSFVSTEEARPKATEAVEYELTLRQQASQARVCTTKERERRPVDPPPIIQLQVKSGNPLAQNYLQNPYLFMCANLVHAEDDRSLSPAPAGLLAGTVVSSLYRLKDINNTEGGFFVFADVSIRIEGTFRLKFSLFELRSATHSPLGSSPQHATHLMSIVSQPLKVYSGKTFPGMLQSTFLSRSFSDQGVRIRIRKEHRIQMKSSVPPEDEIRPAAEQKSRVNTSAYSYMPGSAQEAVYSVAYEDQRPNIEPTSSLQMHSQISPKASSFVVRSGRRDSQPFHPYPQYAQPPNSTRAPRLFEYPALNSMQPPWQAGDHASVTLPTHPAPDAYLQASGYQSSSSLPSVSLYQNGNSSDAMRVFSGTSDHTHSLAIDSRSNRTFMADSFHASAVPSVAATTAYLPRIMQNDGDHDGSAQRQEYAGQSVYDSAGIATRQTFRAAAAAVVTSSAKSMIPRNDPYEISAPAPYRNDRSPLFPVLPQLPGSNHRDSNRESPGPTRAAAEEGGLRLPPLHIPHSGVNEVWRPHPSY